jgi:hypothetical protein
LIEAIPAAVVIAIRCPILRGHLGELDRAANLRPCDRDARR